ncbi:hypothetical protein GCM10022275_18950 [Tessaracoccus defluvii]
MGDGCGHKRGGGGLVSGVARGVFACGGAVWVAEPDGGDAVAIADSDPVVDSQCVAEPVAVSDGGGVVSG